MAEFAVPKEDVFVNEVVLSTSLVLVPTHHMEKCESEMCNDIDQIQHKHTGCYC